MSNTARASRRAFGISLVVLAAALAGGFARASHAGIDLSRALAHRGLNPARTSIAVADASTGELIATFQPDQALNPASCAKIFTSAAALRLLGPDHRFRTNFYADAPLSGGTIGTLYVAGEGDPLLVTEELWRMAQGLSARGLRRATRGIAIDNSFFDSFEFPRKVGNDGRAYTAKTSAVAVNFNSLGVWVGPGPRAGSPGTVTLDPPIGGFEIENRLVTRPKFTATIGIDGGRIRVVGRVPPRGGAQLFWRGVPDPVAYAGEVIRYVFAQNGIDLQGPVVAAPVPRSASGLASEVSRPLSQIVADMNKFSNNFIAEQLVKHLGALRYSAPGSTEKGVAAVSDFLASLGIPAGSFDLENGSGLSERTRVSAAQLVAVLTAMYRDRALREPFVDSLAVLGVDGTMKTWGRMAPELVGVLRAKTGTISGVSALAGYVPMRDGRMAAFAILVNGTPRGMADAHQAELAVVRAIAEGGR